MLTRTDRALVLIRENPGMTALALMLAMGLTPPQIRQILTALRRRRMAEGRGYPARWYAVGLPEIADHPHP